MTDVRNPEAPGIGGAAILFGAVGALIAVDVLGDLRNGAAASHLVPEIFAMSISLAGVGMLASRLRRLRKERTVLGQDLRRARDEAERWRKEAGTLLAGLGEAVSHQFERWELSPAEQEVALLLLKGLSHKEIGNVRETSERTVRQQALAVYRKAGLAGRAELAAFFFEDLLLPVDTADRASRTV